MKIFEICYFYKIISHKKDAFLNFIICENNSIFIVIFHLDCIKFFELIYFFLSIL